MKTMKTYRNENLQKLIILEGFMQNGLQNRNQRKFLRIESCVKIVFRHLLKKYDFDIEMSRFDIRIIKNYIK